METFIFAMNTELVDFCLRIMDGAESYVCNIKVPMDASIRDLKNIVASAFKCPPDMNRLELCISNKDWFNGRKDDECVMNELIFASGHRPFLLAKVRAQ